jgi:hypothetical protein
MAASIAKSVYFCRKFDAIKGRSGMSELSPPEPVL